MPKNPYFIFKSKTKGSFWLLSFDVGDERSLLELRSKIPLAHRMRVAERYLLLLLLLCAFQTTTTHNSQRNGDSNSVCSTLVNISNNRKLYNLNRKYYAGRFVSTTIGRVLVSLLTLPLQPLVRVCKRKNLRVGFRNLSLLHILILKL